MIRILGSLAAFALLGAGILGVRAAGTSAVPLPDNVVLFGSDAVQIGQETNILGGDTASNNRARIGRDAFIEGSLLADRLTLQQDATIIGNAEADRIRNNGAAIQGETITPRATPDYELPTIPDSTPGTERIRIRKDETTTLEPGSYGAISIGRGANVTLAPGTYDMRRLHVGRNAILTITDETMLNVRNSLFIGAGTIIDLAQNFETRDLSWNVRGHGTTFIGKGVFGAGNITAPRGTIHLGKETTWRGKLIGKRVRVGKIGIVSRLNTFARTADPEDIIEDPGGGTYPINLLLVSFVPGTTTENVKTLADAIGGRVVGMVPSITLFQIEVPTNTISGLEALMEIVRNRQDLGIDGVLRDFIIETDI